MKKSIGVFLSLLLFSFFTVMVVHGDSITPMPVDVTLTSYFDATNHPTTQFTGATAKTYGSSLKMDGSLATLAGYEFAFWIINGVVRFDLAVDATFIMTDGLDLKAVFHPTSPLKYAVAFLDSNGQLIDLQYVVSGENAVAPSTTTLSKPGYAQSGWSHSYTNVTTNVATILQYSINDPAATLTLSVTSGTGAGSYAFNSIATVVATDRTGEPTPMYFAGWENDGIIVSNQSTYSFTVLDHMSLTATYQDSAPVADDFHVNLSDKFSLRSGKSSFLGQFYLPTGYTLVEFGVLISDENTDFDLTTEGITKLQGKKYHGATKEWLMSITAANGERIRAYLVVKNASNEIFSTYSTIRNIKDLYISEYGEGSDNNKWIEIFNPSAHAVNLGAYTLKLFSNGSASATAELTLSGTLAPGNVYVIALSEANATILGAADQTNAIVDYSGDDALGLYHDSRLIDQFGVIGTDPGTSWTVGTGSTADHTLVRITNLDCPNAVFNPDEWTVYDIDTTAYIGYQISPIDYAISFNSNGGSAVSAITQNAGTAVTAPTAPTKTGMTFAAWYSDAGLTTPYTFSTMPAADITLYAKWTSNTYTISFVENGGTEVSNIDAYYDASVSKPANPTRTYYSFVDWYEDSELTIPYVFTTMPLDGITVYAKWQPNVYNVTYYYAVETMEYQQISTSGMHTIALTVDGQLLSWGWNNYGQLGNGTTTSQTLPVDITARFYLHDAEVIIQAFAFYGYSVVLTSEGRVFCFGSNSNGLLGDGTTTNRTSPVEITTNFNLSSGEKITQIFAGKHFAFALSSANRVFSWGSNTEGQLGAGDSSVKLVPQNITSRFNLGESETITFIAGGSRHAMALSSAGRVFAWGYNSGTEYVFAASDPASSLVPRDITANLNLGSGEVLTAIECGSGSNIAITSSGRLLVWGYNSYGELGTGTTNSVATPVDISSSLALEVDETVIAIKRGATHTLVLTSNGRIFAFGRNNVGQLGDGTTVGRTSPVETTSRYALESGEVLTGFFLGYGADSSFVGTSHGRVFAFGHNDYGILGDNTTTSRTTPILVNHTLFSYYATSQFDYLETIALIADPTRAGYTFVGWYTDSGLTQAFALTSMPPNHITLYAKWE